MCVERISKREWRRGPRLKAGLAGVVLGVSLASGAQGQSQAPALSPAAGGSAQAAAAPDVTGVWIDHTGRGVIEVVPCGARVCGYVYWVKSPINPKGQPLLDHKNPDAKRRGKPMCGTQILVNLQKQGAAKVGHVWGAGAIYDPEEGAMFDAEIKLLSADKLSVLGYLGMKLFGESFVWTRAPANLVRCDPARV